MNPKQSQKDYYSRADWDESAWLEIVAVEYETLVSSYPFKEMIAGMAGSGRPVRVLDVGCGSGIFPRYLGPELEEGVFLVCDLLDISATSLDQAGRVLNEMPQFQPGRRIQALIEDIPEHLMTGPPRYDLIWAIHSFTTVDVGRMPDVYRHLAAMLRPGGRLLVFQLSAGSAYQILHTHYRSRVLEAHSIPPYMSAEDSASILAELSFPFHVIPMEFDHIVPGHRPGLLEHYLRKVVLDEQVDAGEVFNGLLDRFRDPGQEAYRFRQRVHLIEMQGSGGRG